IHSRGGSPGDYHGLAIHFVGPHSMGKGRIGDLYHGRRTVDPVVALGCLPPAFPVANPRVRPFTLNVGVGGRSEALPCEHQPPEYTGFSFGARDWRGLWHPIPRG